MADTAAAMPTKRFFVSMLTRDISLADAILDLLDNCLDGAMRIHLPQDVIYENHKVDITLSSESFSISDNCGGIPRDIARNYAFKMGRDPDDDRDNETETIGMYGVGMKRAIFKMGRESTVSTKHGGDAYKVDITSDWLELKEWKPLPITDLDPSSIEQAGTKIEVRDLFQGVSRHFSNSSFINELRTAIAEHFTTFLQRGLRVTINGENVDPVQINVLVHTRTDAPQPFMFKKTIDDVEVSVLVGLNTGRSIDDDEENLFDRERSSATAGWTVFCNDRAVIVGDKSRLTGWGDGIPLYHPQFSVITGVVQFRAKLADKLPVTTTKRALDTSSNVWLETLVKMKEGLRIWVSYTNDWKNHPRSDQTEYWRNAKPLAINEAVAQLVTSTHVRQVSDVIELNPLKKKILPSPPGRMPSSKRIVFARPLEEIKIVSKFLFDTYDQKPGAVGEKCFEAIFEQAKAEVDG